MSLILGIHIGKYNSVFRGAPVRGSHHARRLSVTAAMTSPTPMNGAWRGSVEDVT